MEIEVQHNYEYASVLITEGGATIDTGLLDTTERNDLADKFIDAADELRGG